MGENIPNLNWKQKVLRRNRDFACDFDVRKEKEDPWLNEIKIEIASVKGRLNISSKSTTAANVHLTRFLLDNWQKNNHITVDIIYSLRSLLVSGYFLLRVLVSKIISQPRQSSHDQRHWHLKELVMAFYK